MKFAATLTRLLGTAAIFAASPLIAQDVAESPLATEPARQTATPPAGPALWKVADEDTTIYLFGTVHFLPKDLEWLDEDISAALSEADLIVKELGPEASDPAVIQEVLIKLAFLPEGETMEGILNPEQYALFSAERDKLAPELGKMGIPPMLLDRVQPWFASLNLVVAKFSKIGFSAESGVETVLKTQAPDTPRAGLETVEFQFGLFAGLPRDEQINYMMETIEAMDEVAPALDEMVGLWMAGDAEGLAVFMNEAMTEADVAEALLYKRNANWAEWIETRLNTPGTVFIAVGAGHLAGTKSVQELLEKRTLKVERVQ